MKNLKVGVVLSGCGHLDGAEITETVCALLALDRAGIHYEGIAPNRDQMHVVNHVKGEEALGSRNIMEEAARIMRGNIKALDQANVKDYDAIICPGGFGAAKNLFDLAVKSNSSYVLQEDALAFLKEAYEAKKPMGFICISPMMIPLIYPEGTKMTIGTDKETAKIAVEKGAEHVDCEVDEVCVDQRYKVVSTPAYMLGHNTFEVSKGIDRLVNVITEWIQG